LTSVDYICSPVAIPSNGGSTHDEDIFKDQRNGMGGHARLSRLARKKALKYEAQCRAYVYEPLVNRNQRDEAAMPPMKERYPRHRPLRSAPAPEAVGKVL
jgi:hypothetical protein